MGAPARRRSPPPPPNAWIRSRGERLPVHPSNAQHAHRRTPSSSLLQQDHIMRISSFSSDVQRSSARTASSGRNLNVDIKASVSVSSNPTPQARVLSARDALDARIYKLDFRVSEAYSTSSATAPHTSRPANLRYESLRAHAQHSTRYQLQLSPTSRPSTFSSHPSRARVTIPRPATPTLPPTPRVTPLETPPAAQATPASSPQPSDMKVRTQPQVHRAPSKVHEQTPQPAKRTPPEPEDSLLSPSSSPESNPEPSPAAQSARTRQPDRQAGNIGVPAPVAYQPPRADDSGNASTSLNIQGCSAYSSDASPRRLTSPRRKSPAVPQLGGPEVAVREQLEHLERLQHQALRALIDQCSPAVRAAADPGPRRRPVSSMSRPVTLQTSPTTIKVIGIANTLSPEKDRESVHQGHSSGVSSAPQMQNRTYLRFGVMRPTKRIHSTRPISPTSLSSLTDNNTSRLSTSPARSSLSSIPAPTTYSSFDGMRRHMGFFRSQSSMT